MGHDWDTKAFPSESCAIRLALLPLLEPVLAVVVRDLDRFRLEQHIDFRHDALVPSSRNARASQWLDMLRLQVHCEVLTGSTLLDALVAEETSTTYVLALVAQLL